MCIHICILCCIHIYIMLYTYKYVYIYWICLQNRKPRYLKSLPRRNWQDLEPRRVRCSLCDIGEMDSLIIPAVNVSQLTMDCLCILRRRVLTGFRYWPWAMSHVFLLNILNGVPQITQVFHSQKCSRYAASPRRTPPEEAPGPEESKANIQNEHLGEELPTWLAGVRCSHLVNKWAGPP